MPFKSSRVYPIAARCFLRTFNNLSSSCSERLALIITKIYHVIISDNLSEHEEERLLKVPRKHRAAIGYTLDDLKGISPALCQHKINIKPDAKPVVDHQRRLNLKMKEVVRMEILKLLEAGIIYPIDDIGWVSHVHCVPKKGGITVVPNDKNELIPQRIVTGYRMVIDFTKLN